MINGVLVERTVKDVLPALETNSDGLKKVLDELVKQYKRQQEEMEKWKVSLPSASPRRCWNKQRLFVDDHLRLHFRNLESEQKLTMAAALEKEQYSGCATVRVDLIHETSF